MSFLMKRGIQRPKHKTRRETRAGWDVIGTARANSNTDKLAALAPFKIVTMDTSDEATILEAARQLEGVAIDLLINNAGIGISADLTTGTKDAFMRQFEVNAVGPFLVTRGLLPNLELAAKSNGNAFVVQLSSFLGSIGGFSKDTAAFFKEAGYGYSSSKAALNMINRSLSFDLSEENIVTVALHLGYVDTDMTRESDTLLPSASTVTITKTQPSASASTMADFITTLTPESAGRFFNPDPQIPMSELPW